LAKATPLLYRIVARAANACDDLAEVTETRRPQPYVSVGWPRRGKRGTVGQCWCDHQMREAGERAHIFVSPKVNDPIVVLAIVLHEIIHDLVGVEHGHKGPFRRVWGQVGFAGKATECTPGDGLVAELQDVAHRLGAYPHSPLVEGQRAEKQKTRYRKWICPGCGQIVRAASDDLRLACMRCSDLTALESGVPMDAENLVILEMEDQGQ
jgi:ribosomal protein S27AE